MADGTIHGVSLRGIAASVPERVFTRDELVVEFGEETVAKLEVNTGSYKRHRAPPGQTTADLCEAAAKALLPALNWDPGSVDAVVLVTQSPDYIYPASACCLHEKLGLTKTAAAFDVNLGCSGWVYGVWMASCFMLSGLKRVLLLTGETHNKIVSPYDGYLVLAGDAGTATALEADSSGCLHFSLGTDGRGWRNIYVPAGGARKRSDETTKIYHLMEDGIRRSEENAYMNGPEVFTFTIREVPPLIERILQRAAWGRDVPDAFVFHQANKFILDYLVKRMKLPADRVPLSLMDFGNTSSASIPLTIQHCLRKQLTAQSQKLVMAGFGVGYSWGAVAAEVGPLAIPELVLVP